jgi:predicted LPLAT superfamily acyltransferase
MTEQAAPGGWREVPERGTVLGIRIVGFVYRVLGRRVAAALVWWVALFYVLVRASARKASRGYLQRMGLPSGFGSVHAHFYTFGRVALDRLVFMLGRGQEELKVRKLGQALVLRLAGERSQSGEGPEGTRPRGGIFLGSHIGSFEAMRALTDEMPLTIVVDFRNARRITRVLTELAPQARLRIIGLDPSSPTSMLDVKACVDRGEFVAVLGDRAEDRASRTVTVDFLGEPAKLPVGPYLLAHMLRCPVYFVAGLFFAPDRYDLFCEPFAESVKLPREGREEALKAYAQQYAQVLESFARRAPYNWFNFYDFWS